MRLRKVNTYDGNPSERGYAFADGRQVIEELAGTIALTEALHLLNDPRRGLQQLVELCRGRLCAS